jgi:WD40 repeat protein
LLRSPRLILVVDQFEEVFTECADERERRAFVRALRAAAALPHDGSELPRRAASRDVAALVIVGMRADFYARCAADPDLAACLKADQILVGPMTPEGLRAAIEGPAAQAGLAVDDGLTEVLLADLGLHVLSATLPDSAPERAEGVGGASAAVTGSYQAGRLPLLAYALQQTWQNREGRRLTVSGYQASGGINGAVARAAEEVYEQLSPEGRQAARRLLLRLVNPGEDSADTRRRVPVAELSKTGGDVDLSDSSQAATVREVLADLVQARLLTADTSADDIDTVEITHEALLWAWPRLREWLGQDRAGRRTHRDITNAAREWRQNDYEQSHLFTGTRLAVALEWAADHRDDLNSDERTFLATCQQRQSRATLLRRGAAATLAVLILLVAGTVAYALHNRSQAAGERIQSIANHAAAEAAQLRDTNPSLAAQLELVANRLDTTPDSTSQLLRAASTPLADLLAGNAGPVASVAYSPDGHTLAVGTADSKIQLWNVANPSHATPIGRPLTGPANGVNSVAFSPVSHILAAAGGDGKVWLWDVTDPARARARPPRQLPTDPSGGVESVAFSPDGHILAAGTTDGTVRLWNVTNGAEITQIGRDLTVGTDDQVSSLAFSPHSHILAAGTSNSGAVWLWHIHGLAGGSPIGKPLTVGADGIVGSVAFSPDGQTLAAGTGGSTIWLWDVTDLAQITLLSQPLTGAAGTVTSLAFSPDDSILAAGTGNEAVWLWNITNPGAATPIGQPLTGAAGTVSSVAFSPDGLTLAAGSSNQTIQLWNLQHTILTGPAGPISSVAFGPGGHTLAAGSGDTKVWLWKVTSAGRAIPMGQAWTGTTDGVSSVTLSPDGHTLSAGNYDGLVRIWNLPPTTVTGPIGPTRYLLTGPGGPIYALTFSPDGHTLAAGTAYRGIQLWNVSAPAHPTPDGTALKFPELCPISGDLTARHRSYR